MQRQKTLKPDKSKSSSQSLSSRHVCQGSVACVHCGHSTGNHKSYKRTIVNQPWQYHPRPSMLLPKRLIEAIWTGQPTLFPGEIVRRRRRQIWSQRTTSRERSVTSLRFHCILSILYRSREVRDQIMRQVLTFVCSFCYLLSSGMTGIFIICVSTFTISLASGR